MPITEQLTQSLRKYLASPLFRKFAIDWISGLGLLVYFFLVAEKARPFQRQFKLNDYTIQHPFAYHERVTGVECILLALLIPLGVITGVIFTRLLKQKNLNNPDQVNKSLHLLQISVLGLLLSLSINGVFTDILKNWIARPRPDFLQRCGAPSDTDPDIFVDASICTAPLGEAILLDGMRSTPSGHSSISFSGLLYLSLWLLGQFKLFHPIDLKNHSIYRYLLAFLPILLCFYVALSRVQDYRHHFSDIILGSIIGIFFANLIYHKYFNSIWNDNCDKPASHEDDESLLPIYNDVSA
ncbi:acid phosphatase/Vanadium-dependent haloperoxidase [Hyphopichia burtonii NRRL Y-1933]|uniref:Acid phosphatase/Vanadium-dependent haloperoxidase n=1 Tax=Hyphopichia burtonii NRRL Y-1933 TaxID=984485 RepID=A0A1E4RFU7_9ASCO|nr:acid phosphatase/Vanadium-dependent haloperoxidase [Hyphopichia burtonii NRRL Y-1933]ODV66096.1 acid phosphatase/Vanadium-dependent haloperoxidase [Hyphopichia burtonii NRRL Y-1933]